MKTLSHFLLLISILVTQKNSSIGYRMCNTPQDCSDPELTEFCDKNIGVCEPCMDFCTGSNELKASCRDYCPLLYAVVYNDRDKVKDGFVTTSKTIFDVPGETSPDPGESFVHPRGNGLSTPADEPGPPVGTGPNSPSDRTSRLNDIFTGVSVGGVVLTLIAASVLVFRYLRKRRTRKKGKTEEVDNESSDDSTDESGNSSDENSEDLDSESESDVISVGLESFEYDEPEIVVDHPEAKYSCKDKLVVSSNRADSASPQPGPSSILNSFIL